MNSCFLVNDPKEWLKNKEPVHTATALYDFTPASSEELALKTGQKIWIAPQSLQPKNLPGWWRATDSIKVGLIPASYVTIVGHLKKKIDSNLSSQVPSNIYQTSIVNENLTTNNNEDLKSPEVVNFDKNDVDTFVKSNDENIYECKEGK